MHSGYIEDNFNLLSRVWKANIPSNVVAFSRKMLQDKIQIKANMRKRRVAIIDNNFSFPFYLHEEETTRHLFFNCIVLLSMDRHRSSASPCQHCEQHLIQGIGSKANQRGLAVWFSMVWSLWLHRNSVIFKSKTIDAKKVFELAKIRSWYWLHSGSFIQCVAALLGSKLVDMSGGEFLFDKE